MLGSLCQPCSDWSDARTLEGQGEVMSQDTRCVTKCFGVVHHVIAKKRSGQEPVVIKRGSVTIACTVARKV